MFEWFKNLFRKGGVKLGAVEELKHVTDHPKIGVNKREYNRILENTRIYQNSLEEVEYLTSNGVVKKRPKHTINVSKIVSRKLAKMVFNDGVNIEVSSRNKDDNEFIQKVFRDSKFRKNFVEELEAGYAIGGLVLRLYNDGDNIKFSYCQANTFLPLQSNTNDISEGVIITKTVVSKEKKTLFYTLFEFHEWKNIKIDDDTTEKMYVISNELYLSEDKDKIGTRIPLNKLEKYKDLEEESILEGFKRPQFVYIKMAGKNNKDLDSPLSIGVIDNSKEQIKDLNDKYDQFMNEIEEAKRKIIASDQFFKVRFDSNGRPIRQFDNQTAVFHKIKSDDMVLQEFVPNLRTEQFIESINFILRIIEMNTGFSAGTFSFDGQSVKTATEVISENSETYSTRADNVNIVEEALRELVHSIFELADSLGLHEMPESYKVAIDFDDGVFESKDAKLEFYGKAKTLGLLPTSEAMQRIFKVDKKMANEWLSEMLREEMIMDPMEQETQLDEDINGVGE